MRSLLVKLDALVTIQRVSTYSAFLLTGYALGFLWLLVSNRGGLDPRGVPLGADFIIFYTASHLALTGNASLAYVNVAFLAAERTVVPASRGLFLWAYPPTFQLVVSPLALAPYRAALAVWSGLGLSAYLAVIRALSKDRRAWLLALAFPGVFMNLSQGQAGFLTIALMGGGLIMLDRRPSLAGALLGLLVVKPHFGILLPLLLVASNRWRAIAGATASAAGLCLAATAAFGLSTWNAFTLAGGGAWKSLTTGALPIYKVPSAFAALLRMGAPWQIALAIHGGLAIVAIWLVVRAWRLTGSMHIKAGLAILATLIVLPYAFDYDLTLLAIPIGVGLKAVLEREAVPGVRIVLVLLAVTPILCGPINHYLFVPFGPLALWCGLVALLNLMRDRDGMTTKAADKGVELTSRPC